MPLAKPKDTMVYVETKTGIKDGFPLAGRSYRKLFEEHEDAEALWVLLPDAREPFRVPWASGAFGRQSAVVPRKKGSAGRQGKKQEKRHGT